MELSSIRDFSAAVRGRRKSLGLSQVDLAERAGVSRQWISQFEAGKPTAELGLVLRLLDALGMRLKVESAESPSHPGSVPEKTTDLDALLDSYRQR